MKQKKWVIAKRLDNDIIEHLLRLRLEESVENKEQFLNPSLQHLQSPASFLGMDTAVKRIAQAIHNQEAVVIWGDFDADGVTSTAILWETLHQLGAQAMPYIPNRDAEGHGFSEAGIKQLIQNGVKLIITVDHGITALEEVQKLNQQGIDVIITDHHEPIRNPGFNLQSSTLEASWL